MQFEFGRMATVWTDEDHVRLAHREQLALGKLRFWPFFEVPGMLG
jgi:hypothetical protein